MEKPTISERLAALKSSAPAPALPDSTASALRCNLVKLAIRDQLSFADYKILAEWLGCYQYVLPADRSLDYDLGLQLVKEFATDYFSASHLFKAYLLGDLIQGTLSHSEQRKILSWTQEYNY